MFDTAQLIAMALGVLIPLLNGFILDRPAGRPAPGCMTGAAHRTQALAGPE
jgi:hypothetical protein